MCVDNAKKKKSNTTHTVLPAIVFLLRSLHRFDELEKKKKKKRSKFQKNRQVLYLLTAG